MKLPTFDRPKDIETSNQENKLMVELSSFFLTLEGLPASDASRSGWRLSLVRMPVADRQKDIEMPVANASK
jgi:hypothetical protein